jgi:hypothetical protein
MNFLDILALFLVILILLVIVNNIMLHGRDLAKYPRHAEKDIQRDIDNYYPGSPNDDYDSSSSDSDEDDDDEPKHHKHSHPKHHPHKTHQFPAKGHKLNPSHVAQYVSSHLPSSH